MSAQPTQWRHVVIPHGVPIESPKLGDFFKKGLPSHLVREISQNTMDNRSPNAQRAELRFSFRTPADPAAFQPYLKALRQHVEASGVSLVSVDWASPQLLIIEDFGTKGLEGPIDDRNADGSFAKFWHRTGDSNKGKGSSAGGRHGVGKVVNAEISKTRAFFGYSVRGGDAAVRSTLLGRSYLKPHRLAGSADDLNGLGTFHAAGAGQPIEALLNGEADKFAKAAGIVRKPDEPGLSLVALWPRDDVTPDAIREAVLNECLYQITAGELVVWIGDQVLDASTIRAALEANPEYARLIPLHDLIVEMHEAPAEAFRALVKVIDPADISTRLSKEAFEPTVLAAMRDDWLAGRPVLVEAQVRLRPKDKPEATASFKLALKHAEAGASEIACVRDDVTVRGAVRWGKRPAVGLLLAQDNALSGFLGDAEGPSHEDWEHDYVKDAFVRARETIVAVKMALSGLFESLVASEGEEPVANALIDFFSWHAPADKKKKQPKPPPPQPPPGPIKSKRPLVRVSQTKDGFTLAATEAAKEAGAFNVTLKCAYAVRFGDAFKEYVKFDFELDKLPLENVGASAFEVSGNTIKVLGATSDLRVHVAGLDPRRDLEVKVRVQAVEGAEADGEAA